MQWIRLLILLSVVTLWAWSSEAQTSGGGPFTHSSTLSVTDGTNTCYPYQIDVSQINSCSGGIASITTGIWTSANGDCWVPSVSNSGALILTQVLCPGQVNNELTFLGQPLTFLGNILTFSGQSSSSSGAMFDASTGRALYDATTGFLLYPD